MKSVWCLLLKALISEMMYCTQWFCVPSDAYIADNVTAVGLAWQRYDRRLILSDDCFTRNADLS